MLEQEQRTTCLELFLTKAWGSFRLENRGGCALVEIKNQKRTAAWLRCAVAFPCGLDCFFLYDCNLASIVSACRAYSVVYIEFTAIWTYCQCWSDGSVVSSSFTTSCFRLSSFRMCHSLFLFVLFVCSFLVFSFLGGTSCLMPFLLAVFPFVYCSSSSLSLSSPLRAERCCWSAAIIASSHFPGS